MTRRQFYWRWANHSIRGRIGWAQLITGLLMLALGPWGKYEYFGVDPTWTPAIVFGFVFAVALLVGIISAPYLMYSELETETSQLRERVKPKIELLLGKGEPYDKAWKEGSNPSFTRIVGVQVRNHGAVALNDCKVILSEVSDNSGKIIERPNESLPRQSTGNEIFPLRPGEEKMIHVARHYEGDGSHHKIMISFARPHAGISLHRGDYVLKIRAFAQESTPADLDCKLYTDESNQLHLAPVARD